MSDWCGGFMASTLDLTLSDWVRAHARCERYFTVPLSIQVIGDAKFDVRG